MGNQIDKLNKKFGKKQAPVKKVPTAIEVKTYIMVAQNKLTLYRNKKVNLIKSKRKEIAHDIEERDHRDMTREIAPLKQAEDAVLVDSSHMTIEEVVKAIVDLCK